MILRRVIAHFRKQEWTAIAIDFLIVVVGVFVGMQVNDWNAARQARARAEGYTARLTGDLRYEAWRFEYLIVYYTEVLASAERAVGALTDGEALSDEQLLINAYRASQYKFYGTQRATFDEMVATGDIGLIADRRLRNTALIAYADPTLGWITDESRTSEFRELFRRATPVDVQRALLKNCGDHDVAIGDFAQLAGSIDYQCALDMPAEKIAAAAARLRADPQLAPLLQQRVADLATSIGNLQLGTLDNLRALVKDGAR